MTIRMTWKFAALGGAMASAMVVLACSSDDDKSAGGGTGGTDAGADGASGGSSSGGSSGSGGTSSGGTSSGGTSSGGTSGDGGPDGSTGGSTTDGGDGGGPFFTQSLCAGKTGADQVECGRYIAENVAACTDCHTPLGPTGPDRDNLFTGNSTLFDLDPADDTKGLVPAPNLTLLAQDGWTADQLKDAIRDGKRSDAHGGGMFPIMPYFTLHYLNDADADALAAFLLQLTPKGTQVPARQPLPGPLAGIPLPVPPIDATMIPDPTIPSSDANYESAMRGKYLASTVGPCMECHTPQVRGLPDLTRAFGGGRDFGMTPWGPVTSLNITPDPATGIPGWTPAAVRNVIKTGVNPAGQMLCPPMPVGPMGAFGGMTDADALDIGNYITKLPPVANGVDGGAFPFCEMTLPPPGDGGTKDASTPDASTPDASTPDGG